MYRTHAEFCRDQAQKLAALGNACADPGIKSQITTMAKAWVELADEEISQAATEISSELARAPRIAPA